MTAKPKRSWYEKFNGVDRETAKRIGGTAGGLVTAGNIVKLSDQLASIEDRLTAIEASLAALHSRRAR